MTQQPVRSPLKRIGGKSAAASRIVAAFPPPSEYDRYVEVCGGAAHVLFCKPQYDHEKVKAALLQPKQMTLMKESAS